MRDDPATVMTAASAEIARRATADQPVTIDAVPDDAWLATYRYRGQDLPPVAAQLLVSAPWQAFGSVRADGETIAIGRVAASGDWAGLTAIEVDPRHRRRGLGAAVTAALAGHAAARGISNLYLQVAYGNSGARSLYRRMGFADHHDYHYRVAPGLTQRTTARSFVDVHLESAGDIHTKPTRVSRLEAQDVRDSDRSGSEPAGEGCQVLGTRTKKDTVNEALRRVVQDEIRGVMWTNWLAAHCRTSPTPRS